MGQKVHPIGIRLGISQDWNSTWYAGSEDYANYLNDDIMARESGTSAETRHEH